MKRFKKLWASMLTLAMLAVYLPSAFASTAAAAAVEPDATGKVSLYDMLLPGGDISYIQDGASILTKGTTVTIDGKSVYSADGFSRALAGNDKALRLYPASSFKDYDYLEFDVGIDSSSSYASGNVKVSVTTGINLVGGNWGTGGGGVTSNSVELSDTKARRVRVYLRDDVDSLNIVLKPGSIRKDASGNDLEAADVKVGFANAYLHKKVYEGRETFRSTGTTSGQRFNQVKKATFNDGKGIYITPYSSDELTVNPSGHYLEKEYPISIMGNNQYNEMEFEVGTAAYTKGTIDEYVSMRVYMLSGSDEGVYNLKYIYKLGAEPMKMTLPIPDTAVYGMRIEFSHGFYGADGKFKSFKDITDTSDPNYVAGDNNTKIALMNVGFHKNAKIYSTYSSNNAYKSLAINSPTYADNIGTEWWITDNVRFIEYDNVYRARLLTRNKFQWNSTDANLTFVTEGIVDRIDGYIGVPTLASLKRTGLTSTDELASSALIDNSSTVLEDKMYGAMDPSDYIKVVGYKFALNGDGTKNRNVNRSVENIAADGGTVLWEASAMEDGFIKKIDIDVSEYDFIKIFPKFANQSNDKGYRHAQLLNLIWYQYNSTQLNSGFDEETGIVSVSSKTEYDAGTIAAVGYKGSTPNEVLVNSNATLGTESVSVRGTNTSNAYVLENCTLDISSLIASNDRVKYYFVPGQALTAEGILKDQSVLTDDMLLGETDIAITEIVTPEGVSVATGTAFAELELPTVVSVKVGEEVYDGIGVEWAEGSYDAAMPDIYRLEGTLNGEDLIAKGLANTNNLKAYIVVTVEGVEPAPEFAARATTGIDMLEGGYVTYTGPGSISEKTDSYLKVDGATKSFAGSAYEIIPYKELKAEGRIPEDVDKVEFYVGIAPDSDAAQGAAQVKIFKDNINSEGVKENQTVSTLTFAPGDQGKKITLDMNGFNNFLIIVGSVENNKEPKIVIGDFYMYKKSDAQVERIRDLFGTLGKQKIKSGGLVQEVDYTYASYLNRNIAAGNNTYQIQMRTQNNATSGHAFEPGIYSAVEFTLGYVEERNAVTKDDGYYTVSVYTQGIPNGIWQGGKGATYTVYPDEEPLRVIRPLCDYDTNMRFVFTRYDAAGNKVSSGSTTLPEMVAAVSDIKFYKNTPTATSANVDGNKTFPKFVQDNWLFHELGMNQFISEHTVMQNGISTTMRGHAIGKRTHNSSAKEDGLDDTGMFKSYAIYVTGKLYDRFSGYAAIPQELLTSGVGATANDYIKIYGYNYQADDKYILKSASKSPDNKTLLYSAYRMRDNFCEFFDIDISDYDAIIVESYMPYEGTKDAPTGYRYVGLYNYSTMKYTSDRIEAGYDEATQTVWAESPKARTQGSIVAAVYDRNGNQKAVAVNDAVVLGETTQKITIKNNGTTDATVIKTETLALGDKTTGGSYVDVYYTDAVVTEDSVNLDGYQKIARYMLSSVFAEITEVVEPSGIQAVMGTAFGSLALPDTVSVKVGDAVYENIGVKWSEQGYDASVAGTYTLFGTLDAEDLMLANLKNSAALKASIRVSVETVELELDDSIEKDVKLGGGGFVTGITFHPLNQNLAYARTDVAGAFRYDAATGKWVCITDNLPISGNDRANANLYGIDAIAVDPTDADTVYMTTGMYHYEPGGFGVWMSTDRGNTWKDISFDGIRGAFSGNSENRMIGESLAVGTDGALYCGTRAMGLWIYKNGEWTQATGIPYTNDKGDGDKSNVYGDNCTGIRTIAIAGNTIYVGVYADEGADGGVYMSIDGVTWTKMTDSPERPLEIKTYGNNVYVSAGIPAMGYEASVELDGFWKYDGTSWTEISPEGYSGVGSFDIAADGTIYLAEGKKGAKLWKKAEDAQSWTQITVSHNKGTLWFSDNNSFAFTQHAYVGDIELDGNGNLWVTDGGVGVWKGEISTSNAITLQPEVDGIEVTSTIALAVPTSGKFQLLSLNADFHLVQTEDVDSMSGSKNHRTLSNGDWYKKPAELDISPDNSQYVAMTAPNETGVPSVLLSTDYGETFEYSSSLDDEVRSYVAEDGITATNVAAGNVAVGAAGNATPAIVVMNTTTLVSEDITLEMPVWYSTDFGNSWRASQYNGGDLTGLNPKYDELEGDAVDGKYFYIYKPETGEVLKSDDSGANFAVANADKALIKTSVEHDFVKIYHPTLKAKPGVGGEIWISNKDGLFKSTDFGATWTAMNTDVMINNIKSFGFGKGPDSEHPVSVFVVGRVGGQLGLFRSDDDGATWLKINNAISGAIMVTDVEGDMNTFGRVYVGTAGRGIYYVDTAKHLEVTEAQKAEGTGYEYVADVIYRKGTQNMTAVSALYVDGVLKQVIKGDSVTFEQEKQTGELKVDKPEYAGEGTAVRKVFIWDSLEKMNPIFKAIVK